MPTDVDLRIPSTVKVMLKDVQKPRRAFSNISINIRISYILMKRKHKTKQFNHFISDAQIAYSSSHIFDNTNNKFKQRRCKHNTSAFLLSKSTLIYLSHFDIQTIYESLFKILLFGLSNRRLNKFNDVIKGASKLFSSPDRNVVTTIFLNPKIVVSGINLLLSQGNNLALAV